MDEHLESARKKWENYIFHYKDMPDEERFTKEEVRAIWGTLRIAYRNFTDDEMVAAHLADFIIKEQVAVPGGRCPVCGNWKDKTCWTEC